MPKTLSIILVQHQPFCWCSLINCMVDGCSFVIHVSVFPSTRVWSKSKMTRSLACLTCRTRGRYATFNNRAGNRVAGNLVLTALRRVAGVSEGMFVFIRKSCNGGEHLGAAPPPPPSKKCLTSRDSEMLFSAFSTRYLVKKAISIKCKIYNRYFYCLQIDFVWFPQVVLNCVKYDNNWKFRKSQDS